MIRDLGAPNIPPSFFEGKNKKGHLEPEGVIKGMANLDSALYLLQHHACSPVEGTCTPLEEGVFYTLGTYDLSALFLPGVITALNPFVLKR